jgi:hypothetical protein
MKTWKKKLLWPVVFVAFTLAASQAVFAFDDDDDTPTAEPDGGATAALLVGAFLGVEVLRRKLKRS